MNVLTRAREPFVSVLMPVHNGERHVAEALRSLRDQTLRNIEIVVVDDASSDSTPSIVQKSSRSDPRIRLIRQETNRGVALSLNRGFADCRAEFIARADADDVFHPERLATQFDFMRKHPSVGLTATWSRFFRQTEDGRTKTWEFRPAFTDDRIKALLVAQNPLHHPTIMMRRSVVANLGPYSEEFARGPEDYDLWVRLAPLTQFAVIPRELVSVRKHPDSVMARRSESFIDQTAQIHRRQVCSMLGESMPLASTLAMLRLSLRPPRGHMCLDSHEIERGLELLGRVLSSIEESYGTEAARHVRSYFSHRILRQGYFHSARSRRFAFTLMFRALRWSPSLLRRRPKRVCATTARALAPRRLFSPAQRRPSTAS